MATLLRVGDALHVILYTHLQGVHLLNGGLFGLLVFLLIGMVLLLALMVLLLLMMIAMTSLLPWRRVAAEHCDDHFLVDDIMGGRRAGVGRRDETIGAPLRNDHVHFRVAGRHDAQALLRERVSLEHSVRAASAVGASLKLGEIIRELERGQAARRQALGVVVVHVVRRKRHQTLRHLSTSLRSVDARNVTKNDSLYSPKKKNPVAYNL